LPAHCKSEFGPWACKLSATEWRQRVVHGVSRGRKFALAKSPVRGDGIPGVSFAAMRLRFLTPQPTANAVGYVLSLLGSYLLPLFRN